MITELSEIDDEHMTRRCGMAKKNKSKKQKKKNEGILCERCGNPIPRVRGKRFIRCQWCGWNNEIEQTERKKQSDLRGDRVERNT